MTNGTWSRAFLCLLAGLLSLPLIGQAEWHEVTLRIGKRPVKWNRAIGIPAEAEYRGRKLKAYVFMWGRQGTQDGVGFPDLGVYVEDIESLVPKSELEQFVGPEFSEIALKYDAVVVSATHGKREISISTRLLYDYGDRLDTGFNNDGAFLTNRTKSKSQRDAWMRFLAELSGGFDKGKAVIGGKVLSDKITVEFTGSGLGAQLKELIAFCRK
jgi:hypothetical protein